MDKSVLVYEGGKEVRLMVKCDGETVWLTIDQMADLFGRDPSVIGKHIKAAFSEEELDDSINRQNLPINGRGRPLSIYDLDVVISVGYRVKSIEGVRFRKWATKVLRAILLEGVKRDYRLETLENRVALNENGLKRVEEGLNYLVEQMSPPTMKRVTGFSKEEYPMPVYDIIAAISVGMCIPLGRDIDPGETSRRRFCATQTRRSGEILALLIKVNDMVARCAHPFGAPSRAHVFTLGLC